jgi:Zn-dependent peptidase ImmA (M78 family)
MINIDRLALADCFEPEELVDEIYRQCPDLELPIPVAEIAKACDIVGIEPLKLASSTKLEGILFSDIYKEYGVIFYKQHPDIAGRERFSISHELGHHLLQHHARVNLCLNTSVALSNKDREQEANKFAKLLLMPEFLLRPYLSAKPFSLELVNDLSSIAQVSVSALANRCCEILDAHLMVMIHSKDNVCSYCWAAWSALSGYRLKKLRNNPIPAGSHISESPRLEEEIVAQCEVDPAVWFEESGEKGLPARVTEQTYYQQNGYAITLLVIEPD